MNDETILVQMYNSQGVYLSRAVVPDHGYPPIGSIIRVSGGTGERRFVIRGYEFHAEYEPVSLKKTTFHAVVDEV